MAPKPIVVATDGSRESLRAVEWAALEAARRAAPLRIVSGPAMPPRMRSYHGSTETVADALRATSVAALKTAAGRAAEVAPDVIVDTDLVAGAPARAVTDSGSGASMLVVGARGAGGFAALILGSVSRYAAMHAAGPVVVVREESAAVHRQIAVGVRNTGEATAALEFAFEEAALRGASLLAVHAWHRLPGLREVWGAGEPPADGTGQGGSRRLEPAEISAAAASELAEVLAGWREKYPQVQVSEEVTYGHPGQVLASLSARADLVVLGKHPGPGGEPPGIGSVQHAVLNHGHGPVAIIPSSV
jgi:nucleotide-binding universal stress UspA family protein